MNVLIVCKGFYPQNTPRSFRATELAKELSRQGHNVTVLTVRNSSHADFEDDFGVCIKDLGVEKWKGISLKQGTGSLFRRVVRRLLYLLFLYPDIQFAWMVFRSLRNESGYDLLISIAVPYPIHWGVALARSSRNPIAKVWVADCGDPFFGQENDSFRLPFYFAFIEKWFCSKADYLTVPTEGAIQSYFPEFHRKIRVIPQGFKFHTVEALDMPTSIGPRFAYAGSFIPGRRDPTDFLEFLCSLEQKFEFHIYTSMPHVVAEFARKSEGRVVVHQTVPRSELLRALASMDFLVNFENVGIRQLPSKLIDYAIVGRPVLSIKTGALDRDTILRFLEGDYRGRLDIGDVERYRIENVACQFVRLAQ